MGVRVNLPLSFEGRMSFFKSKHFSIKDTFKEVFKPYFLCVRLRQHTLYRISWTKPQYENGCGNGLLF